MSAPVVFLPGSLCNEQLFEAQLEAIPNSSVADLTGATSIEEMVANVLASAPDEFVAVGLSLGGIVATEIASVAPNRVRALALLDTNLAEPGREQLEQRAHWDQMTRAGDFASVVANEMVPQLTEYPETLGSVISEMAFEMGPSVFLDQNAALLRRRDRRPDLEGVDCPVLIACGSDDRICPPELHRELAARSTHARLEIIDGAGHLSTLDQPAAVTRTLTEWLELSNVNQHPRRVTNEQVGT